MPAAKSESRSKSGFDHFELHPNLARGIRAAGFESPRPIQAETIPAGLEGRDVLGLAQTGTGKTAAFALPILDLVLEDNRGPVRGPRALVLAPTRELATQISEEIRTLAKFTKIRVATLYGGVPTRKHIRDLKQQRPHVVVGCPGRVLDLLGQKALNLGEVETLVLDEADHMFDMGFLPDVRRILKSLPDDRQNLLFSATMPRELRKLVDELLTEPHIVELSDTSPAETVDHGLFVVDESRKRDLLEHLLSGDDCTSAIVFSRTKHRARRIAAQLKKAGYRASDLQGNMSQSQRDRAMRGFRSGRFNVLVATDIAARGIDVQNVSHVINYDVPNTAEAYTHRIGRTGRSEQSGIARTFVTRDDTRWLRATERMIGEPIARCEADGFENLRLDTEPSRGAGNGPKRKRSGKRPPRNRQRRSKGPRQSGAGGQSTGDRSGGSRSAGGNRRRARSGSAN